MALITNPSLGDGGTGFQGNGAGSAAAMIRELQSMKIMAATGAAANTDITVSGITSGNHAKVTLLSVIMSNAGVFTQITDAAVQANGAIRTATDTSGKSLLVHFTVSPV